MRTGTRTAFGVISFILVGCDIPKPPELPDYPDAKKVTWLSQGWTPEQRHWYHHTSQGTLTIPVPYTWFLALERPEFSIFSAGLLSDPDYLSRFGFIPSPKHHEYSPDGLPVGFARTAGKNPLTGKDIDQPGLTCAACHTGQIDYNGTRMLIDGGPALLDLDKFRTAIALSVGLTERLPFRFGRFADRVLGPNRTAQQEESLKTELGEFIKRVRGLQEIEHKHAHETVPEGFGRLDAFNRIGDEVFAFQMGRNENTAPRTAPVAYPHLWNTSWFDWVQYNGSIRQPMVRNAGEAMGVRALINYLSNVTPPFTSTIPVSNLYEMEKLLAGENPRPAGKFTGLLAPTWPTHIFKEPNPALVRQGAGLYKELCQGCHLPPVNSPEFWNGSDALGRPYWTRPNEAGEQYLRMPMISVNIIGTDPAQAVDTKNRTVVIPAALGIEGELESIGTDKVYAFGPALGKVVEKATNRWYDSQNPPTPQDVRGRMNGHRPNDIRDGILDATGQHTRPAYKARPLNGIWATAPYLHNGSVPTLYDLLSPLSERPSKFYLGSREFDPDKVGYKADRITGAFEYDTTRRGNWKTGHLFETPNDPTKRNPGTIGRGLNSEERRALVEYLKTL